MKTYLFDFDGTLIDSMPTFVSAVLKILDDNGIAYGDDFVKIITPLGNVNTAKYIINMGLNMTVEEIISLIRKYVLDAYLYEIPAKNNVIPTLRKLKDEGARLNVLTASSHMTLDPCLKRLGIFDLFDNVWSCDDFGTTKTNPEIYRLVSEKLGVEIGKIFFVDDNYNADKAAKEAGMTVCGLYDNSSKDCIDEIKSVTDYYIYDFSELLKI